MKRISPVLALVVLAACADTDVPMSPNSDIAPLRVQASAQTQAGSYIIVLNPGANPRSVAAIAGVNPKHVYTAALNGFSAELNAGQLNALQHNKNVAFIEADQVTALAPPCGTPKRPCGGGGGGGTAEVVPWGITRVGGGVSGVGKVAWVIDTGIDLVNADLTVDAGRSRDFTGKGTASDANGHGTHVAGTIAAIDNEIGVIGVAAGATVVAVRVLDAAGSGQYSWIIAGVDYVAANGSAGDVANMSLGGGASDALDNAVQAAAA